MSKNGITRITGRIETDNIISPQIDNINEKNTEQDTRLTNIETKNTEQDEKLDNVIKYGEKDINDKTLSLAINVEKEGGTEYPVADEYQFQLNPVSDDIYLKVNSVLNSYITLYWVIYNESGTVLGSTTKEIYISYDGTNVSISVVDFPQPTFDIVTKTLTVTRPNNYRLLSYLYNSESLKNFYCYHSYVIATPFSNNIIDIIYPIGSIHMSLTPSHPLFGTWKLLSDGYFLQSTTTSPGETGGSSTHTHTTANHVLTVNEMPSHTHPLKGYGRDLGSGSTGWRYGGGGTNVTDDTMLSTGGNQPHNHGNTGPADNLPPYITCFMYKRTA